MYVRFRGCGAFIFGVVFVTVMTITWPGACACLNLLPKRRFCEPFISMLVGHGLWVLLGCDMIFFLSWLLRLEESEIERRTRSSFKEKVEVVRNFIKCAVSRLPECFNLDDFCMALVFYSPSLRGSELCRVFVFNCWYDFVSLSNLSQLCSPGHLLVIL